MLTKEAGGEEKDVPNAHLSLFLLLGVLLYGLGEVFFTLYIETVGQTLIAKNTEMGSLEMLSRRTLGTDMPVMAQVNLLLHSELVFFLFFGFCEKHRWFLRTD